MARPHRKERLDELLWRELNSIVGYELSDPRLDAITVSRVDVTSDLQVARVYITLLEEGANGEDVLAGLENAKGFIRNQIAGRVQLRRVPELVFKIDHNLADVAHVERILDSLEQNDQEEQG